MDIAITGIKLISKAIGFVFNWNILLFSFV